MAKEVTKGGMIGLRVETALEQQKSVQGATTDGLEMMERVQAAIDENGNPITDEQQFRKLHAGTADGAEAILGNSFAPRDDADSKIIKLPKKD